MISKFERTHRKIIKEGIELFKTEGFQNVTVGALCNHINIARPTFYSHFNSKESLVAEYYECAYLFSADTQSWILSTFTNWESIIRLEKAYIQNTSDTKHVELISHYLTYKLSTPGEEHTIVYPHDQDETISTMLIKLINGAQQSGEIRNTSDAGCLGDAIMSLQLGNLFLWCVSKGGVDRYEKLFWELESILLVAPNLQGIWKKYDYDVPGLTAQDNQK